MCLIIRRRSRGPWRLPLSPARPQCEEERSVELSTTVDFPKISTTGSAPRVIHSTSLLLAWRSSRRRRRPPRAARAAPDDQTQCLASLQWPSIMLGASRGPGDALGDHFSATGSFFFCFPESTFEGYLVSRSRISVSCLPSSFISVVNAMMAHGLDG